MKQLSRKAFIHPNATVIESHLGGYTEVGRETVIQESELGGMMTYILQMKASMSSFWFCKRPGRKTSSSPTLF